MFDATISPNLKNNNILQSGKITQLADNLYLIPLESHGSDDYMGCSVWSHYGGKTSFSNNIDVIAVTYILNGGAAVVRKKNPAIVETITIFGGDDGAEIKF